LQTAALCKDLIPTLRFSANITGDCSNPPKPEKIPYEAISAFNPFVVSIALVIFALILPAARSQAPSAPDEPPSLTFSSGEAHLTIDQYTVIVGFGGSSGDSHCSSAAEDLLNLIKKSGAPDFSRSAGLSNQQQKIRLSLLRAFQRYLVCLPDNVKSDAFINKNMLPWILSSKESGFISTDGADQRTIRLKLALIKPTPLAVHRSQAGGSSTPHSDLLSPEGIVIGTLFAEDPVRSDESKFQSAVPTYLVEDDGPSSCEDSRPLPRRPFPKRGISSFRFS